MGVFKLEHQENNLYILLRDHIYSVAIFGKDFWVQMNISGKTTPYAVLGHPIGHSLSPVMHNASLAAMGEDAIYLAFDVHPDKLMEVLPAMRAMGFGGVNLTVPLKEVARQGLENIDESAWLLGAVNTVEFSEAGLVGHNTDGYGFVRAIDEAFGIGLENRSVFVLGCGGAGRAVALTCADCGAGSLVLSDVEIERAERVKSEIIDCGAQCAVETVSAQEEQVEACRQAEIVVQASPVGMKPSDPSLLGPEAFREGQQVYDLIYMYPETAFLATARVAGARVANGLGMLLHQGARAYEIWTGRWPDTNAMRKALEEAVYGS